MASVLFGLWGLGFCIHLHAQEPISLSVNSLAVQSGPEAGRAVQQPGTGQPQSSTSVIGIVRDTKGDILPGIELRLVGQDGTADRVVKADSNGAFAFTDLGAGSYRIKIDAADLELFASAPVTVGVGDKRELAIVAMKLPSSTTTVQVKASLSEVATEQVKEQEKQRMFGVLPNYYTSYIWDAAPLTPKLKFRLAVRSFTDPVAFLAAAGVAGVEQARNSFPGYGQGSEAYGKRFGAAYADTVAFRMFGSAIFPTILHQDPRYFYQGSGSVRSRVFYAVLSTFICRGDNGQLEPNYSRVLGSFAAAGLSNVYRAPTDRRVGLTLRNGLIITGSGALVNVLREFFTRKLTPSVPAFANGKP